MFDLLLTDGLVVDGSGSDPFRADLAISQGVVAALGLHLGAAREVRSLQGLVVAPGFVDIHGHSELRLLSDPDLAPKVLQGYTTELGGNCGVGVAPVRPEDRQAAALAVEGILGPGPSWSWSSVPEFFDHMAARRFGLDLGLLIPHGPLRRFVMGDRSGGPADEGERRAMAQILDQALEAGAFGLSTGLFYDPCCYADGPELEALFGTVARRGGLVSVHQRSEGDGILESLDEILGPAERTGARLQVSHLKIGGERNAWKLDAVLERLESASSRGVDVAFDQYPYAAGSTSLYSLLPPRWLGVEPEALGACLAQKESRRAIRREMEDPHGWDGLYALLGWSKIVLTAARLEEHQPLLGRTLEEIGEILGQDPFDAYFDLIKKEGKALTMIDYITDDSLVERIMVHPLQMFGTDGLYTGCPHPRTYSCAYRVLHRYVRDKGLLSVPLAVRKLSTLPAQRMGLTDRGRIAPGYRADLVAFDPRAVMDRGTYDHPDRPGGGMPFVWVRGVLAAHGGVVAAREGRLLRRRW